MSHKCGQRHIDDKVASYRFCDCGHAYGYAIGALVNIYMQSDDVGAEYAYEALIEIFGSASKAEIVLMEHEAEQKAKPR